MLFLWWGVCYITLLMHFISVIPEQAQRWKKQFLKYVKKTPKLLIVQKIDRFLTPWRRFGRNCYPKWIARSYFLLK